MSTWKRFAWALRCSVVVLMAIAAVGCAAAKKSHAQSSDRNTAPENSSNSSSAAEAKAPFSIESEMFTYSAMDAESGAVACNVAENLGATDPKCAPKGAMSNAPGVVIISSDSTALSDFQLWRSDISTMDILTRRADVYCPKEGQRGIISSVEKLISGTPEGQILSIAKALFTTTTVKTPVVGTILDQTMMNDIAGHLRGLGVPVVIPDMYDPHSLVTINEARSPYLAKFLALMTARGCVTKRRAERESMRRRHHRARKGLRRSGTSGRLRRGSTPSWTR